MRLRESNVRGLAGVKCTCIIFVISMFIFFLVGCNSKNNLIEFKAGKNSDDISINGQNFSKVSNFEVIERGKKIGYMQFATNGTYDIYEIKGLSTDEWLEVTYSDEPGMGSWICKNDKIKLPTIKDFGTTSIKVKREGDYFTNNTINDLIEVNKIIESITSGNIEKDIYGTLDGTTYMLNFFSPKYSGIYYREGLVITKSGKYYYHLPENRYIEVTNVFNKFIK